MNAAAAKGSMRFGYKMLLAFVVFALAVTFAMIAPSQAFADKSFDQTKVTITGIEQGDTATAYLIGRATVDDTNNLVIDETLISTLSDSYNTAAKIAALASDVDDQGKQTFKGNSTAMQSFADDCVVTGKILETSPIASDTAGADGVAELSLDPGYYLVVVTGTSGTSLVYQNMVVNAIPVVDNDSTSATYNQYIKAADVEFAVKCTDASPTKTIDDSNAGTTTDQYAVGSIIPFMITANTPDYPASATNAVFYINDEPDAELAIDVDSIKVFTGESTLTELAAAGAYTKSVDATTGKMSVQFENSWLLAHPNTRITVKYQAELLPGATLVDAGKIKNGATTTFNHNPYVGDPYDSDPSEDTVQVYGFAFYKVDSDDNPVKGAEFSITVPVKNADGSTTDTVFTSIESTTVDGCYWFVGLPAGEYEVTETKVPAGLQKCDAFKFDVSAATATEDNPGTTDVETNFVVRPSTSPVVDPKQPALPLTGGAGTLALTIGGVVLIAAAIFVLRRRQSADC